MCSAVLSAQIPFEQAVRDLASPDAPARLRAARMLKDAAYPEAAVPLAPLVTDRQDDIQLEAIAAELNIFLADKIVTRKRVGLIVEVRNAIAAEAAFSQGPLALGPRPVPPEVLTALLKGARDDNPRVGLEALYAFGTLAAQPSGRTRRALLRASGPDVAALVGAADPQLRYAAARVLGRMFAKRAHDEPVETTVGDALISVLNDKDRQIKLAAMQALGAMRYDRGAQALTDLFQYYCKGDLAVAALDALARIAHPASAPLFAAQLVGKTSSFRGPAAEGLVRLGDRNGLGAIQTALGADRGDTAQLASAFASAMLGSGSIDAVADGLRRPRLRDQAMGYLIELVPGRAPLFARLVQDPDARMRADLVDVLGLSEDPAAEPIAEGLLKDPDAQVARAAERAVARIQGSL